MSILLSSFIGWGLAHVPTEFPHRGDHHFMQNLDHRAHSPNSAKSYIGGQNSGSIFTEIPTRYVAPPLNPTFIHILRHAYPKPSPEHHATFRPSQPLHDSSTTNKNFAHPHTRPFSPHHEKIHSPFEPRFQVEREEVSDEEWQLEILASLQESGLVPSVLENIPTGLINVNFGTHNCVHMGTNIHAELSAYEPSDLSWPSNDSHLYTLVLIDVDDQNKLHWLVINIPKDDYHKGDTIAKYSTPTPPLGHTHRYVMMVMSQEHLLIEPEIQHYSRGTACETHGDLNLTEFQDTQGLSPPVAVNFFTVSHTEFVDNILAFCGQMPIVS